MESQIFGETVVFWVGRIPVTATMVTSLAISLTLVGVALALRVGLKRSPTRMPAALALLTVEWLDRLVRDVAGRAEPALVTLAGSLFLFIAACNLCGQLPGVRPPTASLATTSALAAIVFFAVPVAGIRARGLRGYLLGYFRPNPLFAPLHVISEFSRTLALSMRLFGNMMGGESLLAVFMGLGVGLLAFSNLPVGIPLHLPFIFLELLTTLVQALVFTLLSTIYISLVLPHSEEAH